MQEVYLMNHSSPVQKMSKKQEYKKVSSDTKPYKKRVSSDKRDSAPLDEGDK